MTVAEALKVLDDASTTRRARTAFDALHREIEATGGLDNESDKQDKSSSGPSWPDAKALDDESGDDSAKGGNSPDGAKGTATARKGSS